MHRHPCASLASLALASLALAAVGAPALAQGPQLGSPREIGLDAGLVVGLGDESSINVDVPAARARLGFFLPNNSRWSLEPALGLSYVKVEEEDGILQYNVEGGLLYHFRPPAQLADEAAANRVSVAYVRPFVNIIGFTGEDSDSEVSLGAGLGVKIPWRPALAWRLELNTGYGFDNEAFRIGAYAGLSFFPR
ncbi:MAG TPA: hypothetical protein VFS08_05580 [Gemmatimonadaceae bacterium]|nr:hypothetical protein [Gemmatimonadaceae bacterium]